jgi:hypothetical protein
MVRVWTEEELDRTAADLVDETILAAGGDVEHAEQVLRRTHYLVVPRPRLGECGRPGPCTAHGNCACDDIRPA